MTESINAFHAYIALTRNLLNLKRIYSLMLTWKPDLDPELGILSEPLNEIFSGAQWLRCGRQLSYTEWNVNGVFPLILYNDNNRDFDLMLKDSRFAQDTTYMKREAWNSFVGRTARARPTIPQGMLAYTLERLKRKRTRGFNHFYLPVEDPEWVFAPLAANPRLPKTGRTACACVMNFSINFDTKNNVLHVTTIMRSSLWSHVYGDIFGTTYFVNALLHYLEDAKLRGQCHIYFPCVSMDLMSKAKTLFHKMTKVLER